MKKVVECSLSEILNYLYDKAKLSYEVRQTKDGIYQLYAVIKETNSAVKSENAEVKLLVSDNDRRSEL